MIDVNSITAALAASILLLVSPLEVQAQPAVKVYRIGVVSPLAASPEPPTVRTLRRTLRDLGYIEGKNVAIEVRYAEGRSERLPGLFAEMIKLKVDVLVTGSTEGALAAKKATTTVPIVFAGVIDVVSTGIVASLARPEGNITGATFGVGGTGFAGKWVELLKEAVPGASLVAVLSNPANLLTAQLLPDIDTASRALKVRIERFEAGNDATLDKAFTAIGASGAHGMIVPNNPFFAANRAKLVQFAAAKRLPVMYFFNLFPDSGGLMSYGGSLEDSYRRAATYVDKILKGAKPGDLPVDQPTKFELVVNLKAAKALGITLPRSFLLRVDRVIE